MTVREKPAVFLFHHQKDEALAAFVTEALANRGVEVETDGDWNPGEAIHQRFRENLVESVAVILLVTPNAIQSEWMAFVVGMTMAWSKPLFILFDGIVISQLPGYLLDRKILPAIEAYQVADLVLKLAATASDDDLAVLKELYVEFSIPSDQLLLRPSTAAEIAEEFGERTGKVWNAERVVREIVRLRKSGRLPKIQPAANSA